MYIKERCGSSRAHTCHEVPGSAYYAHDGTSKVKGACFAIPALPPTTLGWPGLQWVYAYSEHTCIIKYKVARVA